MIEDRPISRPTREVEFEREDLASRPIFIFLITLALGCVLVYFILKGMYSYLDAYENRHQPPPNALVEQPRRDTRTVAPGDISRFPQPRLQSDERLEINDVRLQEENTLHSYGWVNQPAGVVRIPIDRAMQLLAQRGLPTRPQAGAVPPSDVNTAREAARRSDTSRQPKKQK
jgi:hypothetical protein